MSRRRIVLDTNCLISSLSKKGQYYPVWKGLQTGQYILCVSTEILEEYAEVIAQKMSAQVASSVIHLLLESSNGSNLLLGVTGAIKGGPLAHGAVFILMMAILLPSLIYGISTDTFHTARECVEALSSMIRAAASFLLTMLVAAQLMETVKYTHLDALAGISPGLMSVISFLVYWIPLPIIIISDQKRNIEV